MTKNYLTTRQAAQLLGVSLRTVQLWLDQGLLEGWKTTGGHRRLNRQSVEGRKDLRTAADLSKLRRPTLSVLVVEDDSALLRLYRLRLQQWDFPIDLYTAPNGYEGLVMVGEVHPDLLVCDLRLPGVNGFEIVRSLQRMERYRSIGIVVVSGLAGNEVLAHGGLPEQVQLMSKPLDFMHLQTLAHERWEQKCRAAAIARKNSL